MNDKIIKNKQKILNRIIVLIPILSIMWWLWHFVIMKNLYDKHIDIVSKSRVVAGFILCGFLLLLTVAFHSFSTLKSAILYSALIGFIIYGCSNAVLLATLGKWNYTISIIDTMFGVLTLGVLGYFIFILENKYPSMLKI